MPSSDGNKERDQPTPMHSEILALLAENARLRVCSDSMIGPTHVRLAPQMAIVPPKISSSAANRFKVPTTSRR